MKKKIRKLLSNRVINNFLVLFLSFFLIELIFRLLDELPIFTVASIRIILGISILALFLAYITSFFPRIVNKVINLLIVLAFSIYGIAEMGFHHFLGVYASVGTNTQLGAVTSYFKEFISSFKGTFYLIFIPFLVLLIYYLFFHKRITLDLPKKKLTKFTIFIKTIPVFILVLLSFLYYGTLKLPFMQDKFSSVTSYELFLRPTSASLVVRDFGFISYGLLDLKEYFWPGKIVNTIKINPQDLQNSNQVSNHTVIDNDLWLKLIDENKDQELNALNHYFISNDVTKTNDYTGLFEGKNLIVIMVESANDILLNEKYYPNVARLVKNGYSFVNNYSPRNICSTGNNEMSAMISLYSINNNCTANVYQNNTYFESIFNLFNESGYTTNSFHDYYDWYYDRMQIHKNMGSNTFYDADDLGLDYNSIYGSYDNWPSDEELMEKYLETIDEAVGEEPFMSFITTVSSHQPYSTSSEFGDLYMDLFPQDYSLDLKRYMSKLKVVDNAIGILLDGLESRGILEDTVIVLFGDHYPYAIDTNELNDALEYDISIDNNADQVPLIIYNTDVEAKEFSTYTSYINILPTIANLFNLNYDSRLYMGTDALSREHESLVIFIDGSWKNEDAYYNASTGEIHYYTKNVYSDEEILAINTKVRLKLEMSSLAIENNYFRYLDESLNSITTSNH